MADGIMRMATHPGEGPGWFPGGPALACAVEKRKVILLQLVLSFAMDLPLYQPLKKALRSPRPHAVLASVRMAVRIRVSDVYRGVHYARVVIAGAASGRLWLGRDVDPGLAPQGSRPKPHRCRVQVFRFAVA